MKKPSLAETGGVAVETEEESGRRPRPGQTQP